VVTPAPETRLSEIRVRFWALAFAGALVAIGLNAFGEELPPLVYTAPPHARPLCTLRWASPSYTEWAASGYPAPPDRYVARAKWVNGAAEETTILTRFGAERYEYVIPFGALMVGVRAVNGYGESLWREMMVPEHCP